MDLTIAWRNVWRNPRRTAVILSAVTIGVWSMILLGGLMSGMIDGMVQNSIATLTGHIQIQEKNYPNDPSVDFRINAPQAVIDQIGKDLPNGSKWSTRIRVDAVANNARHNTGVTLVGMDSQKEARISFIGKADLEGSYLEPGDARGILIGKALAEQFETEIGRKIILMSQTADGEVASRAFRIRGIFRAEMQSTEKTIVFIDLTAAQAMLGLEKAVSEIVLLLPEHNQAEKIAGILASDLAGQGLSVRAWPELQPLLVVYLNIFQSFTFIWYLVVFVAMGFGIVNTTLMAVFERMHEFGLLKALGMRPVRIIKNILIESTWILIIGMCLGTAVGTLSAWAISFTGIDLSAFSRGTEYFGMTRIIYPVLHGRDILTANAVVLVLGLVISLYPAVKAARFTPIEAMTQN